MASFGSTYCLSISDELSAVPAEKFSYPGLAVMCTRQENTLKNILNSTILYLKENVTLKRLKDKYTEILSVKVGASILICHPMRTRRYIRSCRGAISCLWTALITRVLPKDTVLRFPAKQANTHISIS